MPYWLSRVCGVCCAPECVSVTRLITHIKCHPSLTQRRRVVSRAVTSSSGSLSRYCVLCVCVCQYRAELLQSWRQRPRTPAPGAWKRSCRPVITRDTWRKEERKRRWETIMKCQTLYLIISSRAAAYETHGTCFTRVLCGYGRGLHGSAVLISSVCQVTTQMLILHFNSNINGWTNWRCIVPCVMALSDSSINVITHIWALILPVGCFKFSAAALIVDTPQCGPHAV